MSLTRALVASLVLSGCSGTAPEPIERASSALTADQCLYFDENGTDTICHATGSAKHPYVLLRLSDQGCINGHANHPDDYPNVNGGTCDGAGCLPTGAPAGGPLPCCSGNVADATCVCSAGGGDCATDADCCGGLACADGTCAAACGNYQAACASNDDCCAGFMCLGATCQPVCPNSVPVSCPNGTVADFCVSPSGGTSAVCGGDTGDL